MDLVALQSDRCQQFIADHLLADPAELMLQRHRYRGLPLLSLVQQIKARRIIAGKVPSWQPYQRLIFPDSLPLQQCSSEATASYKSELLAGDHLVDLTGGLGVDTYFFSRKFKRVTYIEKRSLLCRLAAHNFQVLGVGNIEIVAGAVPQVLQQLEPGIDCLYLDPDRRQGGNQKKIKLEDCQPVIPEILTELWGRTRQIAIKLSPMLDIELALSQLRRVYQVHIVSVRNECRELIFLMERDYEGDIEYVAVNLQDTQEGHSLKFTKGEEQRAIPEYSMPLKYLYEPHASLLKAGAFKLLCSRYGVKKLHPNSHLYTSSSLRHDFPGRLFEIQWTTRYRPAELRGRVGGDQANIAARNFPHPVQAIRKATGIGEGGTSYLFATTNVQGKPMVIGTRRIALNPSTTG